MLQAMSWITETFSKQDQIKDGTLYMPRCHNHLDGKSLDPLLEKSESFNVIQALNGLNGIL